MGENPLASLANYSRLVAELFNRPDPEEPSLASTFPHHKHIPPDIRHNRVPAPRMKFDRPNLSVLLEEIEQL